MARAAVIPQSPPKRATRTRTKGTTTTTAPASRAASKTTKPKAPSSATEARKRGARAASFTTAKRPVDDGDATTDDEIDMFAGSSSSRSSGKTASTKPRGRPPTKATTTSRAAAAAPTASRTRKTPVVPAPEELDSDNDDELAQSEAPKKRVGRPKATKPGAAKDAEAAAPKPRGRPKGAAAKPKVVDELKENTRLNARGFTDIDFSTSQEAPRQVYITTNSSSAKSNLLRGPAKKKKVTFQDPTDTDADELDEPSPPPPAGRKRGAAAGSGRQGGLASKPVRKPAATSGRGRKPAAAKKDGSSKPLSPKKATQVAKGLSSYASSDGEDDELSLDKDHMKAIVQSPPKHGSENNGLKSPVKKINLTGHFRKSLDENGDPLPGPRRSIDFNDNNLLLSSPARRPPPSPFNFSMRETPRRGGGLNLRSDLKPLSQPTLSPTLNSPLRLSPRKANIETPRRGNLFGTSVGSVSQPNLTPGHNSPLKSSPRKGLFGASFMSQSQQEPSATPLRYSTSLLQSPAKKVATPFKASLSVMKSPVPEESDHENDSDKGLADNDAFEDSQLEESPLRLMQTRADIQADEPDEATENVASDEEDQDDEIDPISTTPPHSPSVARHCEKQATNAETAEHDSEETVEYVEDDGSTVAEDVAEPPRDDVHDNVDEPADHENEDDQVMEDDSRSVSEGSDEDEMEEIDTVSEHADMPMEDPVDEVDMQVPEETEESPNAESMAESDTVEDSNEAPSKETADGSPEGHFEEDSPEPQLLSDEEIDDLQVVEKSEDGAQEDIGLVDDRQSTIDETLDDGSVRGDQEEDDEHASQGQDMPETLSDADDGSPAQEREETSELPQEREVERPSAEEEYHTSSSSLSTNSVKDLDDVSVSQHSLPEEADKRLNSSDTEEDPDMMETDDDVDAAEEDVSHGDQEIGGHYTFEENEATIVVPEQTVVVSPSRVPILPYEVEEPENPWSPMREAYYRAMRNISPVRVLPDSPVRRNMNYESPADSPSPLRQGFTIDSSDYQDPFVDSSAATPLRRLSVKRSIFDNAPRFTPLAQQFSQWKATSPARSQPRRSQRPRKGIFSLGGSRRSSSNAQQTTGEVAYPQIAHQTEDSSSEMPPQSEDAEADPEATEDDSPQTQEEIGQVVQLEEVDAAENAEAESEIDENDGPETYGYPSVDSQLKEGDAADTDVAEDDDAAEDGPEDSGESADTAEQITEAAEDLEEYEEFSHASHPEGTVSSTETADQIYGDYALQTIEDPAERSPTQEIDTANTTEPTETDGAEAVNDAQVYENHSQHFQSGASEPAETRTPLAEEVDGAQIWEDPSQDSFTEDASASVDAVQMDSTAADLPHGLEVEAETDKHTEEVSHEPTANENTPTPKSPAAATDAFEENKENEVFSNIPLFTPIKNRLPQMQTVHTVSKVPLKPEGQISPLKISRKRGLSLSGASPVRASTRIRTSTFAPSQQTAPPMSPRKSPRLQRTSMSRPVALVTHSPTRTERSTPAKRPPQSPSPIKSAKASRRSTSAPAPKLVLQGAVVYVDVHTTEGEDASGIFIELLQQMGARCIKNWSWNPRASLAPEEEAEPKEGKVGVTHVVFKDGGVRTLEKVRHARGLVKCVGVGWVLDCERENKWVDETPYAVDSSIIPRGGAKRRKSMEPRALSNVNGTLVKANPTASAGTSMDPRRRRSGIDRSTMASFTRDNTPTYASSFREEESSATPEVTPKDKYTVGHTEPDQRYCHTPKTPGSSAYTFDMDAIGMSPTTPFYLSQRTKLVQQTCPPKQTRQGLFTTPGGPAREPSQKLRSKLEAARRKSMAYKPRVGSPLVE